MLELSNNTYKLEKSRIRAYLYVRPVKQYLQTRDNTIMRGAVLSNDHKVSRKDLINQNPYQ